MNGITGVDEAKFILLCGKSVEEYIDERVYCKFEEIFYNILENNGSVLDFKATLEQYLDQYLHNKYHNLFMKILNHHHDIVLNSPVSIPSNELIMEQYNI
jgi:hypothetical protein